MTWSEPFPTPLLSISHIVAYATDYGSTCPAAPDDTLDTTGSEHRGDEVRQFTYDAVVASQAVIPDDVYDGPGYVVG